MAAFNLMLPQHGAMWMEKVPEPVNVEVCCDPISPHAGYAFPQKHLFCTYRACTHIMSQLKLMLRIMLMF